jgi:hypothetical protein
MDSHDWKAPVDTDVRYIRNNDPQSAYATHILNNMHEYGNINNNMTFLKQINKGTSMNSLEQFYIQLYAQNKKLVEDQNAGEYIPIFRLISETQRRHK